MNERAGENKSLADDINQTISWRPQKTSFHRLMLSSLVLPFITGLKAKVVPDKNTVPNASYLIIFIINHLSGEQQSLLW